MNKFGWILIAARIGAGLIYSVLLFYHSYSLDGWDAVLYVGAAFGAFAFAHVAILGAIEKDEAR